LKNTSAVRSLWTMWALTDDREPDRHRAQGSRGMVFHAGTSTLFPHLTVAKRLLVFLAPSLGASRYPAGKPRHVCYGIPERVKIPEQADNTQVNFPGGQQQRVCHCPRALVHLKAKKSCLFDGAQTSATKTREMIAREVLDGDDWAGRQWYDPMICGHPPRWVLCQNPVSGRVIFMDRRDCGVGAARGVLFDPRSADQNSFLNQILQTPGYWNAGWQLTPWRRAVPAGKWTYYHYLQSLVYSGAPP